MSRGWTTLGVGGLMIGLISLLAASLIRQEREFSTEFALKPPSEQRSSAPASTSVEFEAMLRDRTLALEQLADRCAPLQWKEAEAARDRASLPNGSLSRAEADYAQAGLLYRDAAATASKRQSERACDVASGPTLELPRTSAYDAGSELEPDFSGPRELESAAEEDPTTGERIRSAFETRDPQRDRTRVSDAAEVELRAQASALVESIRACEAIRLLRERGRSERSLELARALAGVCRAQSRRQE